MVTEPVDATHDVVVVGGGIAGLGTAWHLRGLDVLVLEASERIGGRIRSEPRGDVWLNFGAHVFGGEGSATGRLLTETGVQAAQVEGRLAAVALGDRVVASGAVETYPFRLPLPLRSRVALVRAGLKLRLAVRRYGAVAADRPGESAAARQQRMLDFLDDRSFSEFIGPLPADVDAIFRATLNRSSGEPEELAAGYGIGYFHLVWNRDAGLSRNIVGGPSTLIDTLAAGIDGPIHTGAQVTEVVPSRDGVTVRYLQGGVEHEVRARSAVVATPAFVTREIVRGLPADTDAALANVRYGPYVVGAFLTTETRPMPWDDLYALATPGRSFGMLFNTANVLRGNVRQPGGSLMVYAAADAARALGGVDDDEVRARFLADLASIYPDAAAAVSEVAIQRWDRGLPYAAVGRAQLQDALMRPLGPIHLAGDFLGTWYTETACQTAEAAANAVRTQVSMWEEARPSASMRSMEPATTGRRTVDELVAEARDAIERLTPAEAWDAALGGARMIDIRSDTARARDGTVPGSFHIPRTVLEWRLDISSPWRNEHFASLDDALVLFCDHGYSSSLAAFALLQLGYQRVADITGGFEAWRLAGLPTARPPEHVDTDALPGSGPPDDSSQLHRWEHALRESPDRYGDEASAAARATLPVFAAASVGRLLELGAGQGRDTLYFAAAGIRVTALDFTPAAAERLEAKAADAGLAELVTVCRHDVRAPLPLSDESYDACYSHMLFCMALDEAELIALAGEIRRTLRPGGICVYTARTTDDPDFGKGTQLGDAIYESGGFGVHFFDSELVSRLAAGYELLEVDEFEEGSLPRKLVRVTMQRA